MIDGRIRGALRKGSVMGVFGRCEGGGRRVASRSSAPLMAVFTTLTGSHSAVLVDVSSTGARLRGAGLPKMGEELMLNIETVQAFGTVVWSESGECGIAFEIPLPREDEETLRQKVSLARGLPPDIQAAFDNWVIGRSR